MSELSERLRRCASGLQGRGELFDLLMEAAIANDGSDYLLFTLDSQAAEIERLTKRVERMREAFLEYVYETMHLATPETIGGREYRKALIPYAAVTDARAALAEEDTP